MVSRVLAQQIRRTRGAVKCDATTMLSVQTGDRPTKLSQMFKISPSVEAMGSGKVDELTWTHTVRSSAPPAPTLPH